jgi:serine/threonine protein kinase
LPVLPGYEILGELGRGGMGVVFKARQLSVNRLVALKLIRDGSLAGPQERARFRIEAEAAARVRHPNVVEVFEIGEHQGRPFFSMELIEGGSLDKYLNGRPQPPRLAAVLLQTLARAVEFAHAQKVIHRDLKPGNILMQNAECGVRKEENHAAFPIPHLALPKISDFGLAKRLDSESTAWTQPGAVLGTAGYMAPEQAAGRTSEIGPAADVYALGAIFYELLTGHPPFQAESWNTAIAQVLNDEPAPPTQSHAEIPGDLETICLKCLEKEPAARYTSAGELADDISRYLEGRAIVAVPLGEKERLARFAAKDGFELLEQIGRGPRSIVYRALSGPLKQPVAVKVFSNAGAAQEEWEARIVRTAQMWAGITHPNVVTVQRAGRWHSHPYVVMEYVPQGSLVAAVTGRPYALQSALSLVEKLADVVSYLHRQGIVHGNLKPSNVLLAADGIPRLSDFRPTGGLFQDRFATTDGDATGLCYLAPELLGDLDPELHPHADVYGLGLILYELLTGRPAFTGETAMQLVDHLQTREVEPPSQFNPEVSPSLEAFCLRCLRKNPWRRYHRAYDLVTRLQYFQDHPQGRLMPGERPRRQPGSQSS